MRGGGIFVLFISHQSFPVEKAARVVGELTSGISVAFQVLKYPETGLFVRHRHIHKMLLPVLVDRETLERQHPPGSKLRLYGAGDEDRALHIQILDPTLHQ